jgi:acyl dehydratase
MDYGKITEMDFSTFAAPRENRYFEDYEPGRVYEFGSLTLTETDIIEFAKRFDPQIFHVDPEGAKATRFGGVIASGWHTICIAMRLFADHYLSSVAGMASPGADEVRWPNPVRPGDSIRIRVTTLEAKPSRTKPDRGVVRARVEGLNQKDEPVLSFLAICIMGRRPA